MALTDKGETVIHEGGLIPPPSTETIYLRETYGDDPIIQGYANVIDANPAMWDVMNRMARAGIDFTDYKLRAWNVEHHHERRDALTSTVSIDLINVKVGLG